MKVSLTERFIRWADQAINGSPPREWILEEALEFVRYVDPFLREAGFTLGLTGSVVLSGRSEDDLDVIVYPLSLNVGSTRDQAADALKKAGMKMGCSREYVTERWRQKGSVDTKWVEAWRVVDLRWKAKRVDVFFLQ